MNCELVCRTCLQIKTPEACRKIDELENNSDILEMLSYSIPEMNMYLVIHPVICDNCINLVQTVYRFKSQCLKIEENLLRYAQTLSLSKINLLDYFKRKISSIEPRNNNIYKDSQISTYQGNHRKIEYERKSLSNKPKRKDFCDGCKGCQVNSLDPIYHLKTNFSPFTCYHCDKKVDKIIDLRRHILSHVRQRRCKICGKGFRDLTVLRRHLWSHTGAKQFACNLCPKKFQQKQCLDQHVLKHQGNDKIKCTHCQKLFSTRYNAKVHMRTMHKKVDTCDLCGKKFVSKQELVRHLETRSKSCGNVIKTQTSHEDFIKAEPEFISIEDNFINKLSDHDNENRLQVEARKDAKNDYDILHFSIKEEIFDDEKDSVIPKEEDID